MADNKITPFLWFDDNAEEAMNFYCSVFPDAKVEHVARSGPDGPAFSMIFELAGQRFYALNGGPVHANFTEAISFFVDCKDQAEVDRLWEVLTADGGEESQCGWLKDKYGLSWQIIPTALMDYLGDPDPEKSGRVMEAMLKMQKIVIADLDAAASAGVNRSEEVDAFMANLSHPLKAEVELVRTAILGTDERVHEEIKWNAPSFFIDEHFATFNLRPQDVVQVVLHTGAKKKAKTKPLAIDDPTDLLDWKSPDRCLATFSGLNTIPAGIAPFEAILDQWINQAGPEAVGRA